MKKKAKRNGESIQERICVLAGAKQLDEYLEAFRVAHDFGIDLSGSVNYTKFGRQMLKLLDRIACLESGD
jgi:2-iminoacetate synthase ThiH